MAHYDLKTSQLRDYVGVLKAGDTVSLTGTVYTARDAAHKKILAALENGEQVPFDIQDSQTHAMMLARQGIISNADAADL